MRTSLRHSIYKNGFLGMDTEAILQRLEEETEGGTFNFQKAVWNALDGVQYDTGFGGYSIDEQHDENRYGVTETTVYFSTRALGEEDTQIRYKGPGFADRTVGMEIDRDLV